MTDPTQIWLAVCWDAEGSADRRQLALDDHRRYVDRCATLIAFSGPLVTDDGGVRIGQVYTLRVDGRGAAEAFVQADPFWMEGVFGRVEISRVLPKFQDGERRQVL
jgi:hypothetical protein